MEEDLNKIELKIKEDLNKLLVKLQGLPEFSKLRCISEAYDEGVDKYIQAGLIDKKQNIGHQLVSLIILTEIVERILTGQDLGVYDNDMLHIYFVSDDDTGLNPTF